jgi:acetyltransferase-like isoleucine patch superfamily enzyme
MSLRAELADVAAAIRGDQRAYYRHARSESGRIVMPRGGRGGLRDALVRYRFLRKVRRWKASGVRFGRGVLAMPSASIDTAFGWLISIGDRTRMAEEVRIICHDAGPERDLEYGRAGPVTIGSDCVLNERVIVLPGVTIGDGCLIGAGSVVAGDIPPGSRAMGVPARVYGTTQDYLRELRRALAEAPRFGYQELDGPGPSQREEVVARMRAAGNRGFHHDPFSLSAFWVTPPRDLLEPLTKEPVGANEGIGDEAQHGAAQHERRVG